MTDPINETQPHTTSPSPPTSSETSSREPASSETPSRELASREPTPQALNEPAAPAPATSNLRVDPDGPKDTDWREPAWFPPRETDRGPSLAALVVGLVLIAIGLYFFVDRTLGVALPRIQWSTVWPVILIAIGAIVLIRSVSRRS